MRFAAVHSAARRMFDSAPLLQFSHVTLEAETHAMQQKDSRVTMSRRKMSDQSSKFESTPTREKSLVHRGIVALTNRPCSSQSSHFLSIITRRRSSAETTNSWETSVVRSSLDDVQRAHGAVRSPSSRALQHRRRRISPWTKSFVLAPRDVGSIL